MNELTNVEFIKHFLLGGREMEWLITQPSESIPYTIRNSNWNNWSCVWMMGKPGVSGGELIQTDYRKRKERINKRATLPAPRVVTCLTPGVDSTQSGF